LDYDRSWAEYAAGFGAPSGEHWLGLQLLNLITKTKNLPQLRLDLWDCYGNNYFIVYDYFQVFAWLRLSWRNCLVVTSGLGRVQPVPPEAWEKGCGQRVRLNALTSLVAGPEQRRLHHQGPGQ
jgi:hypothetical protein